jgi:hypothetical protein
MNPDELVLRLTSMRAVHEFAEAVRERSVQSSRGWDLSRWQVEETPAAVRFLHHDRQGRPDTAVLCAEAPETCRWAYEAALRLAPVPTTLLLLASGDAASVADHPS